MSGGNATRIRHIAQAFARRVTPAWFAAIGLLVVASLALFVPPYVGMADNGDFFRILYSNGIFFSAPDYDSQRLAYFVREYGILHYYNENGATMVSSQTLFIKLALALSRLFGFRHTFDIRFQAAIYVVLYAAAVYLLVESLTWRASRRRGYMIAGAAIFVFGDVGYTAYFNSFYGESVVLIMTVFALASALLLFQRRFNDYALMAIFGASSLILTASKQQNAPVGVIVALFGIFLVFARKGQLYRTVMSLLLVSLVATAAGTYLLIPETFVNINKYHAMTRGVLMTADNPEKALASFGIDRQYASLAGSIYYAPYTSIPIESEQMEKEFYSKYGFGKILLFYLTHPDAAAKMTQIAAENAFANRPASLGNYEKSAGKPPGALSHFFAGYSYLKSTLAPKTVGFFFLWFATVVGLYVPSFVSAIRKKRLHRATRLPLIAMTMTFGFAGIAVSVIGAGDADLAKHLFLFDIAFDLVCFVLLSDLLCRRLWGAKADDPDAQEAMTETKALYHSARI